MPALPLEIWRNIFREATTDPPYLDDDHEPFNEDITDDDIVNRRPQPSTLATKRSLVLVNWTCYHLTMSMLWETLVLDSPERARRVLLSMSGLCQAVSGVDILPGRFVRKILCLQDNSIHPAIDMSQFGVLVAEVISHCPNLAVFTSRGFTEPSVLHPILDSLANSASAGSLRKLDFGYSDPWLTWSPSQWNLALGLMGSTTVRTLVLPLDSLGVLDDSLEQPLPFTVYHNSLFKNLRILVITPRIFLLCARIEQVLPQLVDIHLFGAVVSAPQSSFVLQNMQAIPHLNDLGSRVRSLRMQKHPLYALSHINACFRLLTFFPHLSELYVELSDMQTRPEQLWPSDSYHPSLSCIAVNLSRKTMQQIVEMQYGISRAIPPELRPMDQLARTLDLIMSFNVPNLRTIRLLGCSQAVLMPQIKEWKKYLESKGINLRWV
ncbi:hypothetical protein EWM64_g2673 [Hericium alpestre]|uniref:Uncharacterized protein n=1 Tax=Hericium alpestre TaxID=135208 RepID=A0A4Z0A602_9AGAM|nr:hypothetical protein EWM64_g2673 [Hericium alpestre]